MPKSVHSESYALFLAALIEGRKRARLTQVQLAERLGKPQSFVSRMENGVRRLDIVEVYAVARAIGTDPLQLIEEVYRKLPSEVAI